MATKTAVKKAPRETKLSKLLQQLDACYEAREFYAGMTLSQAWNAKPTEAIGEFQLSEWRQWFVDRLRDPNYFHILYPEWSLEDNGDKLPPAILAKWDGYVGDEPKAKKRTTKKK